MVAGTNDLAHNITNLIDLGTSEVVAYLINPEISDDAKAYPVVTYRELPNLEHDYVIVTDGGDQLPLGQPIIDLRTFISTYYNFEIYRAIAAIKTVDRSTRGFVTGLSYAEVGIDADELPFPLINLAVSSQDLFYDFQFAKYLFSTSEWASNIRYALISLAYYSFHYDLSRSSIGSRSLMYYPFVRTLHHFDAGRELDLLHEFEEKIEGVFRSDYLTELFHILKKRDESWWVRMVNGRLNERKIKAAREQAQKDSRKNYPLTVKENIQILTDYIRLLKRYDVEPTLVVCPAQIYYNQFLSARIKNEFYQIAQQICTTHDVPLLDYFDSDLFRDEDFYDPTHLNSQGAKKFTRMLRNHWWSKN